MNRPGQTIKSWIYTIRKPGNSFWDHLYKGLYRAGVDSWWMDATEPSFREGFTQDKQEEKTKSAGQTHIGSFDRYLNVYSLFLSKVMYENLRKQSDKRITILTRSAFAGQQQYATAVWSGDITASWEVFRKQLPAGLNLCMSGIPYWTTDIGGFFVTTRGSRFTKGLADPSYKELYLRWFQQGVFSLFSVPTAVTSPVKYGNSVNRAILFMKDY